MSRKPKRKKKKKPQTEAPTMPPPQPPPPTQTVSRKQIRFLEGLGLVLTTIGLVALIELFPRLSASATPPLDLSNQLASSRFNVTNEGYLQVADVMSACFLWKVVEGGFHASGSMARVVMPPENTLRPTEGYTVPCTSENMIATNPPFMLSLKNADLAIVVYYRVWPFTFYRTHRLFRFVARISNDGNVVWDKQPTPEEMEKDYDAFIQAHGGTFPPQIRLPRIK